MGHDDDDGRTQSCRACGTTNVFIVVTPSLTPGDDVWYLPTKLSVRKMTASGMSWDAGAQYDNGPHFYLHVTKYHKSPHYIRIVVSTVPF